MDLIKSDPGSYSETGTGKDRHIIMYPRIIISMLRIVLVMASAPFLQDGVIILPKKDIVKRKLKKSFSSYATKGGKTAKNADSGVQQGRGGAAGQIRVRHLNDAETDPAGLLREVIHEGLQHGKEER